jgi:serine O-acetyltransferase
MNQRQNALIRAILATYDDTAFRGIHHLGQCSLPSYREVVEIVKDLYELAFPGYGRHQKLNQDNALYHVGHLVDELDNRLRTQILRAIRNAEDCCEETAAKQAADLSLAFLEKIPLVREHLSTDVQAAFDGDPAAKNFSEIVFCYPGLAAVTLFRFAHEMHILGVPLIPRMITEYAHSKTGIDIHPGAVIGRRFFIDHGTGVVIGETTEIGDDVKIYQGVTLGALSFARDEVTGDLVRDSKRHPTIENNVVIYANATILGGRTRIGHHAVIGSSAWITRSVAPYITVTIENPRLRYRDGSPVEEQQIDWQI